jgi:hypothetical protein
VSTAKLPAELAITTATSAEAETPPRTEQRVLVLVAGYQDLL